MIDLDQIAASEGRFLPKWYTLFVVIAFDCAQTMCQGESADEGTC